MKTFAKPIRCALLASALVASASGCRSRERIARAPNVGDASPEFSVQTVSRDGIATDSLSLASLRGKTVVLAFFPKAGTPGCTTQMKAYRDRYATLFHDGKGVILLAASTDNQTRLVEWAKAESFPFRFVSDADGALGAKFGALDKGDWFADRVLYVIAPDGRVTYRAAPFRQNSEAAYSELAGAIDKVTTQ